MIRRMIAIRKDIAMAFFKRELSGRDRPSLWQGPPRPGRKMGLATQVGTIPPKTPDRRKGADLASQSGRNWLSAGGHSRLWLIKSALKDKARPFASLCLYQNSNPIN